MPLDKSLHHRKHDTDPKQVIIEAVGDLSGYRLSGRQVLVGIYVPPETMSSGLIDHDDTSREAEYQGKVGLVLTMGPQAFTEEQQIAWPDERPPVNGDWVGFRSVEGVSLSINGFMCRIYEDKQIRQLLPHPDFIA